MATMPHTPEIGISYASGYWYACGYNDTRDQLTQPYVDAVEFAKRWIALDQPGASRPSLQDAFKAFIATVR